MKKTVFYILFSIFVLLFINGCGEDRSHGDATIVEFKAGQKWIFETDQGKKMLKNNFVYIPGGFDVDGDGNEESGFWLAQYEAKENNETFGAIDLEMSENIQKLLIDNFQVYNPDDKYKRFNKTLTTSSNYLDVSAREIEKFEAFSVVFKEDGEVLNSVSPLEAVISLENSQIDGGFKIKLPSEKQWMQVVKLVINNPQNWTEEKVGKGKLFQGNKSVGSNRNSFFIKNSILGDDSLVPKNHQVEIFNLSGGVSEWTSGMVKTSNRFLTGNSGKKDYIEVNNAPSWWKPTLNYEVLGNAQGAGMYHDGSSSNGANDTLLINSIGTGDVDSYAVVARGGSSSNDDNNLVGISAAKLGYGPGFKEIYVGFRAASNYLTD